MAMARPPATPARSHYMRNAGGTCRNRTATSSASNSFHEIELGHQTKDCSQMPDTAKQPLLVLASGAPKSALRAELVERAKEVAFVLARNAEQTERDRRV